MSSKDMALPAMHSSPFTIKDMKSYFGKSFPAMIRKAEIWTSLLSWEAHLKNQDSAISLSVPERDSIESAYKIKKLLYSEKGLFFQQFHRAKESRKLAKSCCFRIVQLEQQLCSRIPEPAAVLGKIVVEVEKVKGRVLSHETSLLSSFGRMSHYGSAVWGLLKDNSYSKTAEFLVESQERATRSGAAAQLPLLSVPLETSYLDLSKGITASSLFLMDMLQWKWLGVSHKLLYSISHQLSPSAEKWIPLFQTLGGDEKDVYTYLPAIQKIFECAVFVAISSTSDPWSVENIVKLSLCFGLGTVAYKSAGTIVDLFFRTLLSQGTDSPVYPLIHGVAQWLAFPMSQKVMLKYLAEASSAYSSQELLSDEATCLRYQEECKREAFAILGLPEAACAKEVRKAFHRLALQYHPDHNPSGEGMFQKLAFAKEMLGKD